MNAVRSSSYFLNLSNALSNLSNPSVNSVLCDCLTDSLSNCNLLKFPPVTPEARSARPDPIFAPTSPPIRAPTTGIGISACPIAAPAIPPAAPPPAPSPACRFVCPADFLFAKSSPAKSVLVITLPLLILLRPLSLPGLIGLLKGLILLAVFFPPRSDKAPPVARPPDKREFVLSLRFASA